MILDRCPEFVVLMFEEAGVVGDDAKCMAERVTGEDFMLLANEYDLEALATFRQAAADCGVDLDSLGL